MRPGDGRRARWDQIEDRALQKKFKPSREPERQTGPKWTFVPNNPKDDESDGVWIRDAAPVARELK
jgi:hypothetical protein